MQHVIHTAPEVRARLSYVREDGSVWHDEYLFEASDFADFLDDLRSLIARIAESFNDFQRGVVKVNEGSWCQYCCPAYQSCPAKTAVLRQLVPTIESIEQAVAFMTSEQAAIVWERFKNLAPIVKRIDKALKEYARTHEVVLSNGQVLAEVDCGRTNISGRTCVCLGLRRLAAARRRFSVVHDPIDVDKNSTCRTEDQEREGRVMGFNKVIAEGNIAKDPELKTIPNGESVLNFSVGANEHWKNKSGEKQERCEWFNCSLFGKRADALAPYLKKGSRVLIEGKLRTDKYEKGGETRYSTKVILSEIVMLDGKKEGGGAKPKGNEYEDGGDNDPSSIPF